MDQNTPRDDVTGAHPPAASGSGEPSGWNQTPGQGQSQSTPSGGQAAGPDYAAWGSDTSYQQPAQQPMADTRPYAPPEPQTATYPAQPPADQQAYAPQQQYQYQQPGYGQPQYYDPNAYGQQYQQPGYYDPNAYGQQYQQPGYGQPYAYAQPGQTPWPAQEYWDQSATGWRRSFIAVLAAWVMLTWGLVWTMVGALVLWVNSVTELIGDVTVSQDVRDLAARADEQIMAVGGIAVILGLIHVIGAVGIFGHRRWGRAFGIVLGLLGVLASLGIITFAAGFEALDVGWEEAIKGEEGSLAATILVFGSYLLIFLAMFVGRRHFKKKGVEG